MNKLLGAAGLMVLVLTVAAVAPAAETVHEVDWTAVQIGARDFQVVPATPPGLREEVRRLGHEPADFPCARITNPTAASRTARVLVLDAPGVSQATYAVTGQVRYESVGGEGYLEMWSVFPGGKRHFSRTLAAQGPMARLHGTAGWRWFCLPFSVTSGGQRPHRLILNVVLPRGGTVELGPLKLTQYAPGEDPLQQPGHWWSERAGGLLGGLLGVLLGTLGAAIGALSCSGKYRGLVLGLLLAGIVFGAVLLAVGAAAVVAHQPYGVYYPLLLAGGLAAALCAVLRPGVRRRYDEQELRRMSAQDTA